MEKNVFWFDIPMNNITIMHKLDSMANLPNYSSYNFLAKPPLFSQRSVYISSTTGFQNEVQMILVMKKGIKLDNVGVIEVTLDFDFPHQLVDKPSFSLEYFFGDFF